MAEVMRSEVCAFYWGVELDGTAMWWVDVGGDGWGWEEDNGEVCGDCESVGKAAKVCGI